MLPYYLYAEGYKKWDKRDFKLFLLTSFFLAFHFIFWISSLSYTSILNSTILVTLNPIFVTLFSFIIFKQIPGKGIMWGIFLVLIGSFILYYQPSPPINGQVFPQATLGNSLALAGGIFASLYLICTSILRKRHSLISFVFPVYGFTFLILAIFTLLSSTKLTGFRSSEYLLLILFALIPQIIGHTSYNWALKIFSPNFIAITILGEPIGATILGILIFKETPTPLAILGAAMILLAILVSGREEGDKLKNKMPS
ncbi:MAG: hypothetical protein DDT42_01321 [candidate division WS2 bacterium]|uniref:EamA domain-containing protein n=1 Tax=Psychracetigena formicireducens TaxID=2986056 RepID=A0A9E2BJA7_PSYF1|nr:hypothetical protein [Candidatus Psychracetigena formicireducens]